MQSDIFKQNKFVCPTCKEREHRVKVTTDFEEYTYKGFTQNIAHLIYTCGGCNKFIVDANIDSFDSACTEFQDQIDSKLAVHKYFEKQVGKLYKHHRGGIYKLESIANVDSDDQRKFPTTAVYISEETHHRWCRPLDEFINSFSPYKG